jgi:hypothetical protein
MIHSGRRRFLQVAAAATLSAIAGFPRNAAAACPKPLDVAQALQSGRTIWLPGGMFCLDKWVLDKDVDQVTIKALPGETPVLIFTAQDEYSILIGTRTRRLTLEGLTLVRSSAVSGNVLGVGGPGSVIRKCKIYYGQPFPTKYDCVKVLADNVTIEDCEIYGAADQGIDAVGKRDLTFRRNRIHHCSNAIVVKGGSRNILIEQNVCYDNRHGAIGLGGTTDPRWHNYANSDVEVQNATVTRNVVSYTNANNIGGGIFLKGAKESAVQHNTIYGAGLHIASGGNPATLPFHCSNNLVSANIIYCTGNDGIMIVDDLNEAGLVLLDNLYYRLGSGGEFRVRGRWVKYAEFKSLVGADRISNFADPLFVNAAQGQFALRSNSPAVRLAPTVVAGVAVSGDPGYDLGAIESF